MSFVTCQNFLLICSFVLPSFVRVFLSFLFYILDCVFVCLFVCIQYLLLQSFVYMFDNVYVCAYVSKYIFNTYRFCSSLLPIVVSFFPCCILLCLIRVLYSSSSVSFFVLYLIFFTVSFLSFFLVYFTFLAVSLFRAFPSFRFPLILCFPFLQSDIFPPFLSRFAYSFVPFSS